jgi:hypothetical protein
MENPYSSAYSSSFIYGGLIFLLLTVIGFWRIFTKAGQPGWASLIPIYNLIVLIQIVGKPIWWFILLLVPCVNFIFLIWLYNLLGKSFGKGVGFTIGLLLLSPIFIIILGFDNSRYIGPAAKEAGGGFTPYNNNDYQKPFDNNPPA